MSEDAPPYRPGRPAGKSVITKVEASSLLRLYAELPNAAAAARQALKAAGDPVTGAALQHFREVDARLAAIIDQIKTILG
jgi:hypothetical protein